MKIQSGDLNKESGHVVIRGAYPRLGGTGLEAGRPLECQSQRGSRANTEGGHTGTERGCTGKLSQRVLSTPCPLLPHRFTHS